MGEKKEIIIKAPENQMQSALLEIVRRKDIDPDRLEKFLNLQIKMEERQAKKSFSEAMANFQGKCPTIPKSKKVEFTAKSGNTTKYNYAPLDEMIHVARPYLKESGLSYSFNMVPKDNKITKLITTIRHINGHEENTEYEFDTIHEDSRMNLSQRRKSALSFAKRAALENALGLVTADEDDDAKRAIDNPVTKEQLDTIKELMFHTETTEPIFIKYLQVESLDDLSVYEAKKAINVLKQKRVVNVQDNKL